MTIHRSSTTVLMISTGRTGTKFFAELLDVHYAQVKSHHASRYSTLINVISNANLMKILPVDILEGIWVLLKKGERLACRKPIYFDANNHLYALPYLAPRLYPNMKVIHIIRDPRDYVRSHLGWALNRPKSHLANFWLPFWQPNGYLAGDMTRRQWSGLDMLERFSWIWLYKNRVIEKIKDGMTPFLQLKFECFFRKFDIDAYKELIQFIGLPFKGETLEEFQTPKNQSRRAPFGRWPKWSDKQCAKLDRICGEFMRKHDYGNERLWKEKVDRGYRLIESL